MSAVGDERRVEVDPRHLKLRVGVDAPLLCYLAGRLQGGRNLGSLPSRSAEAAPRLASPVRLRVPSEVVGILSPMPLEHEREFSAESPVGQYWLGNCVGFRVEGLRGGSGVVEEIGLGPEGVDVLCVRRWGLHLGRTILIPAERVQTVLPWDDTIVLVTRTRPPSRGTVQTRRAAHRAEPVVLAAGAAIAGAARRAASVALRLLTAIGTLLLGLAGFVRRHAPTVRDGVRGAAATLAALTGAYACEARRLWRAEKAAIADWQESRRARTEEPGDEGPLTRAGADETDARRRLRQRG